MRRAVVIRAELKPEQVVVDIDTREKLPVDVAPMPSRITTLTTGDYGLLAMPNVAAVERKSESDFLGCVGVERDRFDVAARTLDIQHGEEPRLEQSQHDEHHVERAERWPPLRQGCHLCILAVVQAPVHPKHGDRHA